MTSLSTQNEVWGRGSYITFFPPSDVTAFHRIVITAFAQYEILTKYCVNAGLRFTTLAQNLEKQDVHALCLTGDYIIFDDDGSMVRVSGTLHSSQTHSANYSRKTSIFN